jgi:3-hydroxybutyryl-CoA dehydratase
VRALEKSFQVLEPGERYVTRGRTVTEADVVGFATLTGDLHPQHVDAEWAAGSRFGERIAHGLLVFSYASGLVGFDPERTIALRGVSELVFKRPARIGDTIHVEGEVVSKRELDEQQGLVGTRWRIVNQHAELVARATVEVVWRREEASPDGADLAAEEAAGRAPL